MCQGRLFSIITVLFLLTGCGSGRPGWASLPVAIYSDPSLMQSQAAQADFQTAMNFWEAKAGRKLFNYKGTWTQGGVPYTGTADAPGSILGNVIFFQNPWPFAANVVGQTTTINTSLNQIQAAMIMINPQSPLCTGDCQYDNFSSSERKAFTHELGHFLGLAHVQDTNNIMNPTLTPGGNLDALDVDAKTLKELTAYQE